MMGAQIVGKWNNLTEARRQSGLSQKEVAEVLDVSRQAVSRWETGAAAPDAAAGEAPRRKLQWGWITAAALALILAAVIAAWALHDGGERDSEIIKEEDMQEEVIDIGSMDALPWEEE